MPIVSLAEVFQHFDRAIVHFTTNGTYQSALFPIMLDGGFTPATPEVFKNATDIRKLKRFSPSWLKHDFFMKELIKPSCGRLWKEVLANSEAAFIDEMALGQVQAYAFAQETAKSSIPPDEIEIFPDPNAIAIAKNRLDKTLENNNSQFFGLSILYFGLAAAYGKNFSSVVTEYGKIDPKHKNVRPIYRAANEAAELFNTPASDFNQLISRLQELFPISIKGSQFSAYDLLKKYNAFVRLRRCPAEYPAAGLLECLGQVFVNKDYQTALQKRIDETQK